MALISRARVRGGAERRDQTDPLEPAGRRFANLRRLLTNRPCLGFVDEEPHSKRTSTRQQLDCARLYNYAVNETVELRFLAVFQHVVDPTRVRTVADKNSAITPLDLRPTVAD
jgi:hypothetical protein